jgi:hypothetical protein
LLPIVNSRGIRPLLSDDRKPTTMWLARSSTCVPRKQASGAGRVPRDGCRPVPWHAMETLPPGCLAGPGSRFE